MGSIKTVLRKKPNSDGHYPIAIRITQNRKSSYLQIGQYIDLKYWDNANHQVKKSHPNSKQLNNLILKKRVEANDKLLELQSSEKRVSSQAVKQHIRKEYKSTSFFKLAATYIENLEQAGKYNRTSAEKPRIKHFREFLKGQDIDFRDISEMTLRRFQAWLKEHRKVSDRTIVNHLIVIRTIYNLAIRENLVEQKHYPFGKGKIVIKFPESVKIGLDMEEIKTLETLELESQPQRYALNVWLLTFYFAGMRVSDALRLKWADFQNGRLFYQMGKNNKAGSLKVPEKALRILDQYKADKFEDEPIFPELRGIDFDDKKRVQRVINNAVKKFNKHLKKVAEIAEIDKPLTMHISRHTFGNISGESISLQMLQKLYRHSSITTTINYQANFMHKDVDDALESVIS
ncbi:MAG: phage integrase SAM-like domain-containing protein [Ekhidna sp.]|nr:phage integrase SAM-like domain-containing protein [Ekhidna sp.]